MEYCDASDVRVLTGITGEVASDAELEDLITLSDQQITDDLGSFAKPVPTRIKHLSALLTAIKVYTRPDLRGGFSVGNVAVSSQQVEESLSRWQGDVRRIYAHYGRALQESPSSFGRA